MEWIRSPIKKKKNISICWKAIQWALDIIGIFLVWKVGNGNAICIGLDPWIGCKWRHALPEPMMEKLHMAGLYCLSDIALHGMSALMDQ